MTSDDHCMQEIPVCIMFYHLCTRVKISVYCLNEVFFAFISNSGLSSTSLLLVYLVNSPPKTPVRDVFAKRFICMLMSKERPVRDFIGKHLSLRGREVKVTVFRIV